MTIFDKHVQIKRKKLSEAICIDKFFFSRHAKKNKYACLINFKNGLVPDILPSRHKADLRSYLRMISKGEKMNVKYVIMDLYDNYRDIVYQWLLNAIVCANSKLFYYLFLLFPNLLLL
ncbi:transposase [Massilimicrobiota timonensis]|uniref:transposase n=1 Tax=Massilimicrobiota timonensis TaxID=1776392 RepID=UPI0036F2D674